MAGSHQTKKKGPHHPALSAGRDGRGQAGQGQDLYAKRENCTQDTDIFPENACNSKQSKESKVKESKAKESRALPPLTPPGESGGAQGNPDLDIPGYAYNRNTHNLECLMLNLEKLYITDREEIRKILKLSDYGRLGNYVWKIFNGTNWSKVNSKGGYIISVLAREKRSTGS